MKLSSMFSPSTRSGLVLILGALVTAGCDTRSPLGSESTSGATIEQQDQPLTRTVSLEAAPAGLTEGMAYADLRDVVTAGDWAPTVDAECKTNVVGANFAAVCATDPAACAVCETLPELASCSGDGHCLMHFQRGSRAMTVSTYGDLADWNVRGAASRLTVKWWDSGATQVPTDAR